MRRRGRSIVSFFMGVIILITSNGIVLASHTCLKDSKTSVTLFKNKNCCGKINSTCDSTEKKSLKSNCCLSSVTYHKTDVSTVPVQKPAIHSYFLNSIPAWRIIFSSPLFGSQFSIQASPLITGGSDLLNLISIFRI